MKVLITGAGGQLGQALQATAAAGVRVNALSRKQLDIADRSAVTRALAELQPDLIFNTAAFNRVDDAETEAAAAARTNSAGPEILASAAHCSGAWLVHVSTDYVFDGAQNMPYRTNAKPCPINVYGKTKLAGELAAMSASQQRCTVVRTSWLYSAEPGNFVTGMLKRMASSEPLRMVSDQVNAPTCASGLAAVLWKLAEQRAPGMYHWCDSGIASRYDLTVAIAEESIALGLLREAPAILPIGSADWPAAARRPRYSVLDKRDTECRLGTGAPHWRTALREMLRSVAHKGVNQLV